MSSLPRRRLSHVAVCCAALALLAPGTLETPANARDLLTVTMDKAKLVKYPPDTETIIIGNPVIADVTMLKSSGLLILTGKSFGETNLLLLDRGGTILSEASLRVEPSDALLTVQRGIDRESYACHPRCEPTVSLGDASAFFSGSGTAVTTRNTLASPTGSGAASGPPGGPMH